MIRKALITALAVMLCLSADAAKKKTGKKRVVNTLINCRNVSVIVAESLTTRLINSPLVLSSNVRAGSNPTL